MVKYALAVLMLLGLSIATHADVQVGDGTLVTPQGSTVTNVFFTPANIDIGVYEGYWTVDYSFPGGTGYTQSNFDEDALGAITFTTPVSAMNFTWETDEMIDWWTTFEGGTLFFSDGGSGSFGLFTGQYDAALPGISSLSWEAIDWGGITFVDPPVETPEPETLILALTGVLLALIGYRYKRRNARNEA